MELPGAPGYKYYGAAKNLPGVRELFAELEEAAEKKRLQRTRGEMRWNLTADYYGFDGSDDPILLEKEKEREVYHQSKLKTHDISSLCIGGTDSAVSG